MTDPTRLNRGQSLDRNEIRRAAEHWLEHLAHDRRLAGRTIVTYRSSLTCWLNILPAKPTARDLQAALGARMPSDRKAVAYNSWVAVEGFLRWWETNGGPIAATAQMRRPAKPRTHRPAMTEDEMATAVHRLAVATDLKAKAICYVIICTGARVGEVASLQVQDIDFTPGRERIRFRDRKAGESDDWMPVSSHCTTVLGEYLRARSIPGGYVFPGPNGKMTNQGLEKAWHRVLGDLRVMPHQGRHYFATKLLRLGYDIYTVSHHLGHASIATTQIYLDYEQDVGRRGVTDLAEHMEQLGASRRVQGPVSPTAGPGRGWRRGHRAPASLPAVDPRVPGSR
jgi:integrase